MKSGEIIFLVSLSSLAYLGIAEEELKGRPLAQGQQRRLSKVPGGPCKNSTRIRRAAPLDDELEKEKHLFNPRIKFLPFKLPIGYSNLQLPTSALAIKQYAQTSAEFWKSGSGGPIHNVIIYIIIQVVNKVDDMNEEITFNMDINLEWKDYFIREGTARANNVSTADMKHDKAFDFFERSLDPGLLKEIWKPDIIFENLVKVQHPELISAPVSIKFNQVTGKVRYGAKLKIKMQCEMDFTYYPADTQECNVDLRSSNYESWEMWLFWENPWCTAVFLADCSESNYDIQVAGLGREGGVKEAGRKQKSQKRGFDYLRFKIKARRNMSFHLVQTYLPSTFFIIITWLCFLIPPNMMEGRIAIAMTTLLTLTAMFGSIRENTPNVSYVRAIDIWMLATIVLVFLTLFEFAVVLWLRHVKKRLDREDKDLQDSFDDVEAPPDNFEKKVNIDNTPDEVEMRPLNKSRKATPPPASAARRRQIAICQSIADFLDNHAFLLFSIMFIVFNAVYWPWLLISSKYFEWDSTIDRRINCPVPKATLEEPEVVDEC